MALEAFFAGLVEFFDGQFISILLATFGLFVIMLMTWWVYKKLSTRNIFSLFTKGMGKVQPGFWEHLRYFMKYFLLFPILVFAGFLIFAFSLFVLAKPETAEAQTRLLFIAIVIVSTIRIGAYVNEGLAEDLAKLIPLSMLSIVLLHPDFTGIGITFDQVWGFLLLIPGFIKYMLFTIILEGLLRGGTWLFVNLNREIESASAKQ